MAKSSHYAKWWEWTWDYPRIVSQWATSGEFNKLRNLFPKEGLEYYWQFALKLQHWVVLCETLKFFQFNWCYGSRPEWLLYSRLGLIAKAKYGFRTDHNCCVLEDVDECLRNLDILWEYEKFLKIFLRTFSKSFGVIFSSLLSASKASTERGAAALLQFSWMISKGGKSPLAISLVVISYISKTLISPSFSDDTKGVISSSLVIPDLDSNHSTRKSVKP